MRPGSATLIFLSLLCVPLAAQEPATPTVTGRSWSPGQPSPLPLRIHFFSSRPGVVLDSTAVNDAAVAAMIAAHLPPDVTVSGLSLPAQGLHLLVEVNVYSGGEIRVEETFFGTDGQPRQGCRGESQWGAAEPRWAALNLSHQIRNSLDCVQRTYGIRWR